MKAGNTFLFCLFGISNFVLIGLGAGIVFLCVFIMIKAAITDYMHFGAIGGGVLTIVTGILAYCSRRSPSLILFYLGLLVIVLAGFLTLTVLFITDVFCKYDKDACRELENAFGTTTIILYVLLAADVLNILIFILGICYRSSVQNRNETYGMQTLMSDPIFAKAKENIEKEKKQVDEKRKKYAEKYPEFRKYSPTT